MNLWLKNLLCLAQQEKQIAAQIEEEKRREKEAFYLTSLQLFHTP